MVSSLPPPQRKLSTRFLTASGWIVGTLHVPEVQPLLPFLNETEAFFRLTDVSLPDQPETLPFLALQRRAVIVLIPGSDQLLGIDKYEWLVKHEVTCLFDGGLVMGGLLLPADVRVSDELMHSKDFFVLENCTLGLDSDGEPLMDAESIVFVQASALLGVAELNR